MRRWVGDSFASWGRGIHREITRYNQQGKEKKGERTHTKTQRHEGEERLAGVPPVRLRDNEGAGGFNRDGSANHCTL
jgi:hypothetical protein